MSFSIEDAEVKRDKGKALLIDAPVFDEPVWIPKSVITDESEIWKADQEPGELVVADWFAEKRGWI